MIYQNAIEKYLQKDNDHNPVIMTSVDEVTFVIKPTEDTVGEYPDNWQQIALSLAETIAEKLSLPALFWRICSLKNATSRLYRRLYLSASPLLFCDCMASN